MSPGSRRSTAAFEIFRGRSDMWLVARSQMSYHAGAYRSGILAASVGPRLSGHGRLAVHVGRCVSRTATLNQRVQGSNPCTPTSEFRRLVRLSPDAASQKSRLGSTWEARGGDRAERAVTPDGGIHRFGSAGRW